MLWDKFQLFRMILAARDEQYLGNGFIILARTVMVNTWLLARCSYRLSHRGPFMKRENVQLI